MTVSDHYYEDKEKDFIIYHGISEFRDIFFSIGAPSSRLVFRDLLGEPI